MTWSINWDAGINKNGISYNNSFVKTYSPMINVGEKPEGSWNSEKPYNGGAKVTYKDVTYQAKWWTKGDMPGRPAVWERLGEQIRIEPWEKGFDYKGGKKVTFEGVTYQAKWWTNSDIPGKLAVWEKI